MKTQDTLMVAPADAGIRIDVLVARAYPDCSRARLQALIAEGHIRLDGRVVKPGHRVKQGDRIAIEIPEPEAAPTTLATVPLSFPIVFHDDHLVVINKPAGVVTHPGAARETRSVVAEVQSAFSLASVGAPLRPGVVHRLDKGTSGLMVLARTDVAYHALVKAFAQRRVEKEYIALVRGQPPERGRIEAALARDREHRQKMMVTRPERGRMGVSRFTRLEVFADSSLVAVKAITGRTHQIRVHLAWLTHPLIGDRLYGGPAWPGVEGFCLHCRKLGFDHPIEKRPMLWEIDAPAAFADALKIARDRVTGKP